MSHETFQITKQNIAIFADVAGDPNPIHQDQAAAEQMGLEGPIAHGMYVYCYLLQRLDQWIAKTKQTTNVQWIVKNTRCRFQEPALVGKTFQSSLEVGEEKESQMKVTLSFLSEDGKKLSNVVATLARK